MKKLGKCLLCFFIISLLVGCNEEKEEALNKNLSDEILLDEEGASAVCEANYDYSDTEGYVVGAKFIIYADKDNNVTRIVGEQIAASTNKSTLVKFQEALEENYSSASQYATEDNGYIYKLKSTGNKLYVDTDIDYTKMDMEELSKNSEDLSVYLTEDNRFTLSSVQSMYMALGAECRVK